MTRKEELQELEYRMPKKILYVDGLYPDYWEKFDCPSCMIEIKSVSEDGEEMIYKR